MPELPEVETTRRGITPHLIHHRIKKIVIRESRLRWPVSEDLIAAAHHQIINNIQRRGKYLLIELSTGTLIMHLGMSGSLRILPAASAAKKHDHIDLILDNDQCLRFHDPRRFGACIWTTEDPFQHPLLKHLGPEPLDDDFNADWLYERSRNRTLAIKNFIMDSKIVVGVGNIYASEALFKSGINPHKATGRISLKRYEKLVDAIKIILQQAIDQGGTTLRDFVNSAGQPGYFRQELAVYGRAGERCTICHELIKQARIGQRSSFYCSNCQR